MKSERNYYEQIRGNVMNRALVDRFSFAQLISEHAVYFISLLKADRNNDKRVMMSTWVKISELNKEWLSLMCPIVHTGNQDFHNISQRVINNYSEVLGDYVLDANTIHSEKSKAKVESIIEVEGDFYAALVKKNCIDSTKLQWHQYTNSIGYMIYCYDKYGHDSTRFYHAAADCIKTGECLGAWLDTSVEYKK